MSIYSKDSFLSRDDTRIMKGVAVIWMLLHHLWTFPDRIPGGQLRFLFTIAGDSSLHYIGSFGNICVSLFMFLGGYGTYLEFQGKPYDIVTKLKKLYFAYWRVFLVFIPISFLFFSSQSPYCRSNAIYARFACFSWREGFANFLGLSYSFNAEWWFLLSYVFALITFPFIRTITEKCSAKINLLIIVLSSLIITNVIPALGNNANLGTLRGNYLFANLFCQKQPFFTCFWMGVVAAKDSLLTRLSHALRTNRLLNPVSDLCLLVMVVFLRQTAIGTVLDFFYVVLITIATVDLFSYLRPIRKVMLRIGKESTNMWLIHSFLCYYYEPTAKAIAAPRWGVLSLLLLIIASYEVSFWLTYIWNGIEKLGNIIRRRRIAGAHRRRIRKRP